MGRCVSKERPPSHNGKRGMDESDPHGSSRIPMNSYHGSSIHRQASVGTNSPSMFHVNTASNPGELYNAVLTQTTVPEQQSRVVAIYDYQCQSLGDISFQKGDIMVLMDSTNSDWWYVSHPRNGKGYVPWNFIARLETLECEDWYAGKIQRSLAEKLVSAPNYPRGTYLIRKRDTGNEFALTVNDTDFSSATADVKHYKIKAMDGDGGYYITPKKVFSLIRELVDYYSRDSGGLCCKLTMPAPKMAPVRPDLSYETHKNWEIPREEVQKICKLGDGNFGEVWYGKFRGVVDVAIKMMKPGTMSVDAFLAFVYPQLNKIFSEAQIMKCVNHAKLVRLYAVCTDRVPYYIITEYMANGSLLSYLRNENNVLPLASLVDMCAQVASGMMYLEERKLVHRDLAARNVLVGNNVSGVNDVKVADFGLARKLMDENIYSAQEGAKFPIKWTAPEAATHGNFTVKSDVWSYGILLYEIFTRGHVPYPGLHNREVIEHVLKGYRMPRPQNCPEEVYEIMLQSWHEAPERRPTFETLYGMFDDYFVSFQNNYVPPSENRAV